MTALRDTAVAEPGVAARGSQQSYEAESRSSDYVRSRVHVIPIYGMRHFPEWGKISWVIIAG